MKALGGFLVGLWAFYLSALLVGSWIRLLLWTLSR